MSGKDLLLLVWVHGFKGNEVTFESFPDRLTNLLESTHPSLKIVSRVFPAYQTRGELHAATLSFVDWLTTLVVELENDHGAGGGAGKAKIMLMGHSMGGLLIADAARDIVMNTRPGAPLWPNIIGMMAFDTPYLGLHPHTFKHGLTTAAGYYEQAKNLASAAGMLSPLAIGLGVGKWGKKAPEAESSRTGPRAPSPSAKGKEKEVMPPNGMDSTKPTKSGWSLPTPFAKSLYGLGAVALGAAAVGTAYYRREDFINGWKYGYDHLSFVGNLWDAEGMKRRLEDIAALGTEYKLLFMNYYTYLPPSPPSHLVSRTFIILPPTTHPLYPYFNQASNSLASDEVSAHMGMFNPRTNDGFYDLGLSVVGRIGQRVEEEGVGRSGMNMTGEEKLDELKDDTGLDGVEKEKSEEELAKGWKVMKEDGKLIWVDQ